MTPSAGALPTIDGVTCAKHVMIATTSLANACKVASSDAGASITCRPAASSIACSIATSAQV